MKIGALFAGYGGLDMGVQAVLGGSLAWVSEFDANPSRILAHHHPDVPNLGDITAVDWSQTEPVDIITGGFPCQDVSHAGARRGLKDGTRTGLWSYMRDAINYHRPRLVVAENVRGLLSADADSAVEPCPWCVGDGDTSRPMRALGAVLADLADIGYDAWWRGLRAADVGAPHGRFRAFIFAWPAADSNGRRLRDIAHHASGKSHTEGCRGRRPRERSEAALLPTPTVSDTNGAGAHGAGGLDLRTAVSLLPTPRATDGEKGGPHQRGSSGDLMLPSAVNLMPTPTATDSRASGGDPASANVTLTDAVVRGRGLMPTPSVADVEGGRKSRSGQRSDELLLNGLASAQRFGDYAPAIARWEALTRPAPAPTEATGKGGAHRLSPAFVEWMMGLPAGHVTDPAIWDGMTASAARNAQLKALGNGVVPQQAAEAAHRFLAWTESEAAA